MAAERQIAACTKGSCPIAARVPEAIYVGVEVKGPAGEITQAEVYDAVVVPITGQRERGAGDGEGDALIERHAISAPITVDIRIEGAATYQRRP